MRSSTEQPGEPAADISTEQPGEPAAEPQQAAIQQQPTEPQQPAGLPDEQPATLIYPLRLQKFLARAGVASRRASENLMTARRITVNGQTVTELGSKVDPLRDQVCIDGLPILLGKPASFIMLNKPAGYLTTMADPQGRPTVRELVPVALHPGLFPVGRLDYDTTGLLLFMTDGELAHQLLHPRHHVPKRYQLLADGNLNEDEAERLRQGILLNDGLTLPAEVELGTVSKKELNARERARLGKDTSFSPWQTELCITIREGRKRQIKRMLAALGHPVIELTRLAFGPLHLGDLAEGQWRELTAAEISALRQASN